MTRSNHAACPCLLFLLAASPASAGVFDAQFGVATDELFRGIPQNNRLSVSLRGDYSFDNHFYVGARVLNNRSGGEVQGDVYAGYGQGLSLLGLISARLDGGISGSVYGGRRNGANSNADREHPDYVDGYASLSVGPLRLFGNLSPDYYGTGALGYRAGTQIKLPLPFPGLSVTGALAWNGGEGVARYTATRKDDGLGERYADYSLTVTQALPLSFSIYGQAAGTNIDIDGSRVPTFVLGLRYRFGF